MKFLKKSGLLLCALMLMLSLAACGTAQADSSGDDLATEVLPQEESEGQASTAEGEDTSDRQMPEGVTPGEGDMGNRPEGTTLPEGVTPGEGSMGNRLPEGEQDSEATDEQHEAASTPSGALQAEQNLLYGTVQSINKNVATLSMYTQNTDGEYIATEQVQSFELPLDLRIGEGSYEKIEVGMGLRLELDSAGQVENAIIVKIA